MAAKSKGDAYYVDHLWLPISYQQHFPRLLEAAEKVSVNEYCAQLLDGTLYEEQTSVNAVIFRFRCRTTKRRQFTISVDEKTLTLTNSLEMWIKQQALEKEKLRQEELENERLKQEEELEKERIKQEEERVRIAAELRQEIEEREQYWGVCNKVFTRKANLFNSAKVISKMPPQPDISDDGEYTYYIEFQTLGSRKTALHYLATARIISRDGCDVNIRPI
jgi:hypothetical protein